MANALGGCENRARFGCSTAIFRLAGTARNMARIPTSRAAAEEIADVVEVRDAFASDSASRRFSAFDVGPLWPVANVSHSGRVLDSPQPWPGIPGFAKWVTEAFTAAH